MEVVDTDDPGAPNREPGRAGDEQRAGQVAAARERFMAIMRLPDQDIDLAEAALLIAAEEYPGLDIARYLQLLEAMAGRVREHLARAAQRVPDADQAALQALHTVLFEEEGFVGADAEEYGHPRSSFLNEVLERKRGLPITLSVIYCEVARRAGLDAVGINMPSHFLAQFRGRHSSVLVDPYNHGARLQTPEEWRAFTRRTLGRQLDLSPDELPPASRKMILARILTNLKLRYVQHQPPQLMKALAAVERILIIQPSPEQVRDRGLILRSMGLHALERAQQLQNVDRRAAAQAASRAAQLLGPSWFDLKLYARLAEGTGDSPDIDRTATQIWKLLGRQN